jgi:hypothetical protein
MSGLSRTPGKRVWVNSPPRVRIPLAPPPHKKKTSFSGRFFLPVHLAWAWLSAAHAKAIDTVNVASCRCVCGIAPRVLSDR